MGLLEETLKRKQQISDTTQPEKKNKTLEFKHIPRMFVELLSYKLHIHRGLSYNEQTEAFYTLNYAMPSGAIIEISRRTGKASSYKLEEEGAKYHDMHMVAASPDGTSLWVTDYLGYSFHKIAMNGKHMHTWGKKGEFQVVDGPPTQTRIRYPTCMTFDNEGNIYILDYIEATIRKVDKNNICTTWNNFEHITTVQYNSRIAYCNNKHCIYISMEQQLWKITPRTAEKMHLAPPLGVDIVAIAVDVEGNIYSASETTIFKVKPGTNEVSVVLTQGTKSVLGKEFHVNSRIKDMCLDSKGSIYFSDHLAIYKLGSSIKKTA